MLSLLSSSPSLLPPSLSLPLPHSSLLKHTYRCTSLLWIGRRAQGIMTDRPMTEITLVFGGWVRVTVLKLGENEREKNKQTRKKREGEEGATEGGRGGKKRREKRQICYHYLGRGIWVNTGWQAPVDPSSYW